MGKIEIELNKKIKYCQESPMNRTLKYWRGMKMKKIGISFLFLIGVLCIYFIGRGSYNPSIIKSSFDKTGAEFMRMDIEGTGKIETYDTPAIAAKKLFNVFKVPSVFEIDEKLDSAILKIEKGNILIVIKTKKMQSKNLIYASVMYSQYDEDVNITNIRRSISKAFSIYNVKPSFSSLIQGKYNGVLTISQMKKRAGSIFSSNRASFVEGVDDGNMVSFSGYISGLGDRISYMGKWVNLNTALRYSRTDGCTYIWVGSPIILLEY